MIQPQLSCKGPPERASSSVSLPGRPAAPVDTTVAPAARGRCRSPAPPPTLRALCQRGTCDQTGNRRPGAAAPIWFSPPKTTRPPSQRHQQLPAFVAHAAAAAAEAGSGPPCPWPWPGTAAGPTRCRPQGRMARWRPPPPQPARTPARACQWRCRGGSKLGWREGASLGEWGVMSDEQGWRAGWRGNDGTLLL